MISYVTLIKKRIKFFSYVGKFRMEQLQSHIWGRASNIWGNALKYLPKYEEAVSHIWLCNCSTLNFLIYEENFILFFISVRRTVMGVEPKRKEPWVRLCFSFSLFYCAVSTEWFVSGCWHAGDDKSRQLLTEFRTGQTWLCQRLCYSYCYTSRLPGSFLIH